MLIVKMQKSVLLKFKLEKVYFDLLAINLFFKIPSKNVRLIRSRLT